LAADAARQASNARPREALDVLAEVFVRLARRCRPFAGAVDRLAVQGGRHDVVSGRTSGHVPKLNKGFEPGMGVQMSRPPAPRRAVSTREATMPRSTCCPLPWSSHRRRPAASRSRSQRSSVGGRGYRGSMDGVLPGSCTPVGRTDVGIGWLCEATVVNLHHAEETNMVCAAPLQIECIADACVASEKGRAILVSKVAPVGRHQDAGPSHWRSQQACDRIIAVAAARPSFTSARQRRQDDDDANEVY
jgi:hypothetical protein